MQTGSGKFSLLDLRNSVIHGAIAALVLFVVVMLSGIDTSVFGAHQEVAVGVIVVIVSAGKRWLQDNTT